MQLSQSGDQTEATCPRESVPVGKRVRVRGQRWQVANVRAYDSCELLTLSGIEPSNAGKVRHVITPFEDVKPADAPPTIKLVGRRRWWRVCRSLIANDGSSGALWSARTARMELLPHQLEPALAIVAGLGARVLIADEVGLGKTIQAGLVVAELQARGALTRVLVLTPAGLCTQWTAELTHRFHLRPVALGMQEVKRRKARLPIGVNPWSTEPLVVASIDYVKRPEVLRAVIVPLGSRCRGRGARCRAGNRAARCAC